MTAPFPALFLKRIALLLGLALVAALMLRHSLAYILLPSDPALALRIDPANADALAARAAQLLQQDPADTALPETLARQALQRSPVSAAGARTIAIARAFGEDPAAARRLMLYSESLSRRDLPTQFWLIQDAVQHEDIPRALRHYDIALRSTDESKPLLFPVLEKALGQPSVVAGLIDVIVARPQWAPTFLAQASREAQDLDGLAALVVGLVRRSYAVDDAVRAETGARLVAAGAYDAAWQVYAAGNSRAVRDAIQDSDFARLGLEDGPFGWTPIPGEGLSIAPRRFGAQTVLAYRAATGAGGTVVRQLLILPAGDYRLSARVVERADGSPPALLRLSCAGSGRSIAAITADAPAVSGDFAVPTACPAQWLEIVVSGGDAPMGAFGAIGSPHIAPRTDRR